MIRRRPPHTHAGDPLVPSFDDLAGTEPELEDLPRSHDTCELLSSAPRDTDVVHLHLLARHCFIASADFDVFDDKVRRRRLSRRYEDARLLVRWHLRRLPADVSWQSPCEVVESDDIPVIVCEPRKG